MHLFNVLFFSYSPKSLVIMKKKPGIAIKGDVTGNMVVKMFSSKTADKKRFAFFSVMAAGILASTRLSHLALTHTWFMEENNKQER